MRKRFKVHVVVHGQRKSFVQWAKNAESARKNVMWYMKAIDHKARYIKTVRG